MIPRVGTTLRPEASLCACIQGRQYRSLSVMGDQSERCVELPTMRPLARLVVPVLDSFRRPCALGKLLPRRLGAEAGESNGGFGCGRLRCAMGLRVAALQLG